METENKASGPVVIGDYSNKTSDDFINFIHKLHVTDEQIKSGNLEHVAGLATDTKSGNIVVPPALLKEQGELLYSLLTGRARTSGILDETVDQKILEKILLDAAFKVTDNKGRTILHELALSDYDEKAPRRRLLPLIETAPPEQFELKDKKGDSLLSHVLKRRYYSNGDDTQKYNYAVAQAVVSKVSDHVLNENKEKDDSGVDRIVIKAIKERWVKNRPEEVAANEAAKLAAENAERAAEEVSLQKTQSTITSLLPRKSNGWTDSKFVGEPAETLQKR